MNQLPVQWRALERSELALCHPSTNTQRPGAHRAANADSDLTRCREDVSTPYGKTNPLSAGPNKPVVVAGGSVSCGWRLF